MGYEGSDRGEVEVKSWKVLSTIPISLFYPEVSGSHGMF